MKYFTFPSELSQEALKIAGSQLEWPRHNLVFETMIKDSCTMLKDLINCKEGKIVIFESTGSGAMEAAITNLICPDNNILILNGGRFGEQWNTIANIYSKNIVQYHIEIGKPINFSYLSKICDSTKFKFLFVQATETSSGQLFDIEKLGLFCHQRDITLIVDAIASFLIDEYNMDKFNVDVTVLSSHKGLRCDVGLSFLIIKDSVQLQTPKSFYFNFEYNYKSIERGQPLFSPTTNLYKQLHHNLSFVQSKGIEYFINKAKENALAFRKVIGKEFEFLASNPSNCLTVLKLFDRSEVLNCFEYMKRDFGIVLSPDTNSIKVIHATNYNIEEYEKVGKDLLKWKNSKGFS